jgi:hypothetical protein
MSTSVGPDGWGDSGYDPQNPPQDPTDRPLKPGDPIDDQTTLYIVAAGQGVGSIGTAQALNLISGRTLLAEGTVYDPAVYPDLARFLAPYYGQHQVPALSTPEWL